MVRSLNRQGVARDVLIPQAGGQDTGIGMLSATVASRKVRSCVAEVVLPEPAIVKTFIPE